MKLIQIPFYNSHFSLPKSAGANIVLRSPHSSCNIASHMNDLSHILNTPPKNQTQKLVLFLVVDGGPDFNPNFSINSLYYGSFFFEQNLDALVVTQYCPGYSAFNPVEHLWAPCTQTLTSVYLPNVLPGESIPPCRQTGIDATTRLNKEHVVFNAAMAKVKDTYWKDLQFAGHRVTIEVEPSGKEPHPHGVDYNSTTELLAKSTSRIRRDNPALLQEVRRNARHLDRRIGTLIFARCSAATCEHCTVNPQRCSHELMKILQDFPMPTPSQTHDGHFRTFQESFFWGADIHHVNICLFFRRKGWGIVLRTSVNMFSQVGVMLPTISAKFIVLKGIVQ